MARGHQAVYINKRDMNQKKGEIRGAIGKREVAGEGCYIRRGLLRAVLGWRVDPQLP